jgi:hypothetical protein
MSALLPLASLRFDLGLAPESLYVLRRRHSWTWLTTTGPSGTRGRAYWINPAEAAAWFRNTGRLSLAARLDEVAAELKVGRKEEAGQ